MLTIKENKLLKKFNPREYGFTTEYVENEGSLHTYFKLDLPEEIEIHISCSQYPEKPNKIVETCVELAIMGHYSLLPHINTGVKMAGLIRALCGTSIRRMKIKKNRNK